jgi:hypothetical protein
MTHKEISERLREIADARAYTMETRQAVRELADELDPPRPEPGTVVWWRFDDTDWEPGIVFDKSSIVDKDSELISFDQGIECKSARILGPYEVAIDKSSAFIIMHTLTKHGYKTFAGEVGRTIARAEAMRMEAEQ